MCEVTQCAPGYTPCAGGCCPSGAPTGKVLSIDDVSGFALDSADNPHVFHIDQSSDLPRYSVWTGSGWTNNLIANIPAESNTSTTALTLDRVDSPHLVYQTDQDSLLYLHIDGGSWGGSIVDSVTLGDSADIAVDEMDQVHVGYTDCLFGVGFCDTLYARSTSVGWTKSVVDADTLSRIALSTTASGIPQMITQIATEKSIGPRYNLLSNAWMSGNIAVGCCGETGPAYDIEVASNDLPHATFEWYPDYTSFEIHYATFHGGAWQHQVVSAHQVTPQTGAEARDIAILLDASDIPNIFMLDRQRLHWFVRAGALWNTNPSLALKALDVSKIHMALDSRGYPHVVYEASGSAYYARWDGVRWLD